jgi:uncharacterized protein YceK
MQRGLPPTVSTSYSPRMCALLDTQAERLNNWLQLRLGYDLLFVVARLPGLREPKRLLPAHMSASKAAYLLVVTAVLGSGCGSIGGRSRSAYYPGVYPGARCDVEFIVHHEGKDMSELWPLAVIDFPFSAAVDTVLLPWDLPYWALQPSPFTNNVSK